MEDGDVLNLLNEDREPLSHNELFQLATEQAFYEIPEPEQEPVVCQQIKLKLFDALSRFEDGMNILLQNDPQQNVVQGSLDELQQHLTVMTN